MCVSTPHARPEIVREMALCTATTKALLTELSSRKPVNNATQNIAQQHVISQSSPQLFRSTKKQITLLESMLLLKSMRLLRSMLLHVCLSTPHARPGNARDVALCTATAKSLLTEWSSRDHVNKSTRRHRTLLKSMPFHKAVRNLSVDKATQNNARRYTFTVKFRYEHMVNCTESHPLIEIYTYRNGIEW